MQARAKSIDFVGSAREAIAGLLPQGHVSLYLVAEALGMSVRVLQRRLSEFGLTYSQLVDEVRLELARRLFENSRLNLSDIAQELGYSDAAHFTRAFVRWTGVTPSAFRRRGR